MCLIYGKHKNSIIKNKKQKKNNKQRPTPNFKNYYMHYFSGQQNKICACEFS
jgi:hypothetical protein